jgi:hypothetical protein
MRMIFHFSGRRAGFALAVLFIALSHGMLNARPSPHTRKGAEPQTLQRQMNTVSDVAFYYTNRGVIFNADNGEAEGLFWPRGDSDSYIFGQGVWFATKKTSSNPAVVKDGWSPAGSIENLNASVLLANSGTRQIFASSGNSVFVRQDTDEAFKTLTTFPSIVTALAQLSHGILLIGTEQGLFVGSEKGPWLPTSVTNWVNDISSFGLVSTDEGIFYTPDSSGSSWTQIQTTQTIVNVRYLSSLPNNWMILALNSNVLEMSEDTGKSWDTVIPPATVRGATLASDGSIIIATATGIYQSSDFGVSWVSQNSGLSDSNITFLRSDDGHHFVVASDSGVFTLVSQNGEFGSWNLITHGEFWQGTVHNAVVDSDGQCHVEDAAGEIYTQWASRTLIPGAEILCDEGYNSDDGSGCYTEGEASQFGLAVGTDGADPNAKYISYVGPRYDRTNGSYIPGNDTAVPSPYYSWPVWDTSSTKTFERNYYFGDYISDVTMRNGASIESANPRLGFIGKTPKPVMVSQEDIVNLYSDEDTTNNPEYKPNTGYPIGIDIQEAIYSWGFGRYRDIVFVRYKVKNSSNDTLVDSWIAPAIDPDLGAAYQGAASEDANSYVDSAVVAAYADSAELAQLREPYRSNPSLLDMAYQYRNPTIDLPNGEQYGMIGFSFVEGAVIDSSGNLIANDDSVALHGYGPNSIFQKHREGLITFRDWTIANDPTILDECYNFVSTAERDTFDGVYGDQRIIMSTGPFTLAPGKSAEVTMAVTISQASLTDPKQNFGALLLLTDFAHQVFGEVDSAQSGGSTDYFVNHFQVAPPSAVKGLEATSGLTIEQPYPNPFSTTCLITYLNSIAGPASAIVTDVLGRTVRSYSLGDIAAGEHQLTIGDKDLPAGAYRVTVIVGGDSQTMSVVHTQ